MIFKRKISIIFKRFLFENFCNFNSPQEMNSNFRCRRELNDFRFVRFSWTALHRPTHTHSHTPTLVLGSMHWKSNTATVSMPTRHLPSICGKVYRLWIASQRTKDCSGLRQKFSRKRDLEVNRKWLINEVYMKNYCFADALFAVHLTYSTVNDET